jgi:hypothetical protein
LGQATPPTVERDALTDAEMIASSSHDLNDTGTVQAYPDCLSGSPLVETGVIDRDRKARGLAGGGEAAVLSDNERTALLTALDGLADEMDVAVTETGDRIRHLARLLQTGCQLPAQVRTDADQPCSSDHGTRSEAHRSGA